MTAHSSNLEKITDEFLFDRTRHKYYLLRGGVSRELTGVTTVLGGVGDKSGLIDWAAKQAVEYIKSAYDSGADIDWEKTFELAKTAHKRTRDTAASKGTNVHAEIEEIVRRSIKVNEGRIVEKNFATRENPQVKHFFQWAFDNGVRFLESEKPVYSEEWFVAGTMDFVCEMGGNYYVGDIKTSNRIYDRTPFAQCAAYEKMLIEMGYPHVIDGRLIINLKKDNTFNEDKDVYASYHYKDDLALFEAALEIYRNLNRFDV